MKKIILVTLAIVVLLILGYSIVAYASLISKKQSDQDTLQFERFVLVYNNAHDLIDHGKLTSKDKNFALFDYSVWFTTYVLIKNGTGDSPGYRVYRFSLWPYKTVYVGGDS